MNTTDIGKKGEEISVEYLKNRGYSIIAVNFKAAGGEIDIIAKKDGCIAFVEVKTRKTSKFGYPSEAVDYFKQQKIIRVAKAFIAKYTDYEVVSFDVCEVYTAERRINYIENAFDA